LSYAQGNINSQSSLIQAQPLTKIGRATSRERDDIWTETYPYSLTMTKFPGGSNQVDPGDWGGSILPGQTLTNLLGQVADIDTFTFVGTAGEVVTAWMIKTGGSGNFPLLEVYDPDGVLLSYAQGNINSQSSLIQAQPLT